MSYTKDVLSALAAFNVKNTGTFYPELRKIKLLVLNANKNGSNTVVYTYKSPVAGYFSNILSELQKLFPDMFIYYTLNSASHDLTAAGIRYTAISSINDAVDTNNTLFILSDFFNTEINYNSLVTIGTPSNAIYTVINNRKCWVITGITTFTFNQNFPIDQIINFVSVGAGEGNGYPHDIPNKGGNGGGVVYGAFSITQNLILDISISPITNFESVGYFTNIIGTDINITSKDGIIINNLNQNLDYNNLINGSATGSKINSYTIINGGRGSPNGEYGSPNDGENGPFISDLGIYVAGGGGGISFPSISGTTVAQYGNGGAGGGGSNTSRFGTPNTGGGAFGGGGGAFGGSGVVYLYI